MLLFRSLTLGLVAACFMLLLDRAPATMVLAQPPSVLRVTNAPPQPLPSEAVTVIDVANSVPASQLSALVRLGPEEHVTAVDDRNVANDLAAGAAIAQHANRYVDLTVANAWVSRRVLMILH